MVLMATLLPILKRNHVTAPVSLKAARPHNSTASPRSSRSTALNAAISRSKVIRHGPFSRANSNWHRSARLMP